MNFPLGTSPCCGVASGHPGVRQPANCAALRSTFPPPLPLGELHRPVTISTDMGPGVTAVPSTPFRHQGNRLLMDLTQGQAVVLYAAGQPQTVRPTALSPGPVSPSIVTLHQPMPLQSAPMHATKAGVIANMSRTSTTSPFIAPSPLPPFAPLPDAHGLVCNKRPLWAPPKETHGATTGGG